MAFFRILLSIVILIACTTPVAAFAVVVEGTTTTTGFDCSLPGRIDLNGNCYSVDSSGIHLLGPSQPNTLAGTPGFDPSKVDTSNLQGCKLQSTVPNIGSMTAVGGTYVPVSDLAVTRNTGYLVYKFCVLDALAAKMKEAATTKIAGDTIKLINEGDNGNPLFVTNLAEDRGQVANRVITEYLKDYSTGSICAPFKDNVRQSIVRSYLADASGEFEPFSCTIPSDEQERQQAFLDGSGGGDWGTWWDFVQNPSNSPIFAYANAQQELNSRIAQAQADRQTQLNWGNGFAPQEVETSIPQAIGEDKKELHTVTPGVLIAGAMAQAVGSGFRQLENAKGIDEIIQPAFASLTNTIIANPSGLSGVTAPQTSSGGSDSGNGLSYIDQILQAILDLIQNGGNNGSGGTGGSTNPSNALATLTAALQNEQLFLSYRQQVQTYLAGQSGGFITAQNTCWTTLVQAVTGVAAGASFTPATTTVYATTAINDVITPFSTVINADVSVATTSIATLSRLVSQVASSTDPAVGSAALATLADLDAHNAVHTQAETTIAQQNITDIKTAVDARVSDTMAAWKTGNGWCNASSTAVVQSWFDAWRPH